MVVFSSPEVDTNVTKLDTTYIFINYAISSEWQSKIFWNGPMLVHKCNNQKSLQPKEGKYHYYLQLLLLVLLIVVAMPSSLFWSLLWTMINLKWFLVIFYFWIFWLTFHLWLGVFSQLQNILSNDLFELTNRDISVEACSKRHLSFSATC